MSGRYMKKIRKELKRQVARRDLEILPELKAFINEESFWTRVRIALKIIRGRF